MKNSNELFILIKSLNRNEKGYFKKFANINSKHGEGNYIRLFDCIDQMDDYDESVIKSKFKSEKFIKQLNVTKLYLQRMIIKSLRNYHSDTDSDIERLNTLIEVQMLIKKQLYDSALRLIRNLREKNMGYESCLTQLHMDQAEYQIFIRKGMYKEILATGEEKLRHQKNELQKYENLCEYRFLQGLSMSKTQMEGYTRNASIKEIELLLQHPLLSDPSKALSFNAKLHREEILLKCYLKLGDGEKAYETAKNLLSLFESDNTRIEKAPYNYFAALNSCINRCTATYRFEEALRHIDKAQKLVKEKHASFSDSQRFEINIQMAEKKLTVYSGLYEFQTGVEAEQELLQIIGNKPVRSEFEITTKYFSAVCYFGLGLYNEALDRINAIIHHNNEDIRKDLKLTAHVLNILTHYEMGNHSLIKRLVTMAENYAIRHQFPKVESIEFFKGLGAMLGENATKANKANKAMIANLSRYDFMDGDLLSWWFANRKTNSAVLK